MTFEEALAGHGFERAERRETHVLYRARPNRFATYSVHVYPDGTALFTWEFAIVDYLASRGIVLGSSEALNTFMYPEHDETGPQDGAWLTGVVDRTEATLASLDFADPGD
ncbi:MAG TPA: hypothetical protein VID47_07180 [Actinomycetota bacterium]